MGVGRQQEEKREIFQPLCTATEAISLSLARFPRKRLSGNPVNKGRRMGFGDVWGGFEGDREHHRAR